MVFAFETFQKGNVGWFEINILDFHSRTANSVQSFSNNIQYWFDLTGIF